MERAYYYDGTGYSECDPLITEEEHDPGIDIADLYEDLGYEGQVLLGDDEYFPSMYIYQAKKDIDVDHRYLADVYILSERHTFFCDDILALSDIINKFGMSILIGLAQNIVDRETELDDEEIAKAIGLKRLLSNE